MLLILNYCEKGNRELGMFSFCMVLLLNGREDDEREIDGELENYLAACWSDWLCTGGVVL